MGSLYFLSQVRAYLMEGKIRMDTQKIEEAVKMIIGDVVRMQIARRLAGNTSPCRSYVPEIFFQDFGSLETFVKIL